MEDDLKILTDIPSVQFTNLKEPKEWDNWHLEQHKQIIQELRLLQLKIDRLIKAITILNDNFAHLEKMKVWIKTAYDTAVYNITEKFITK